MDEPLEYGGLTAADLYHFLEQQEDIQPLGAWAKTKILAALRKAGAILEPSEIPEGNRALLAHVKNDQDRAAMLIGETLLDMFFEAEFSLQILARDTPRPNGAWEAIMDVVGEWLFHVGADRSRDASPVKEPSGEQRVSMRTLNTLARTMRADRHATPHVPHPRPAPQLTPRRWIARRQKTTRTLWLSPKDRQRRSHPHTGVAAASSQHITIHLRKE